jgi:hypothetical protein
MYGFESCIKNHVIFEMLFLFFKEVLKFQEKEGKEAVEMNKDILRLLLKFQNY